MPFPPVERVKYNKTPLESVVCQLRFPPILMIDSQPPYEFQNLIRSEFPYYEESVEVQQEVNAALNVNFPNQIVNPVTKVTSNKNHEFKSEDSNWLINLTRTFISIRTNNYSTWEEFIYKFRLPLQSLIKVYQPANFTRVGLRYVDVFCRSRVGLDNCEWNELIRPYFLGLLGSTVSANVSEFNSVSEIKCQDNSSTIRISSNMVKRIDNNETCFLMDSDVFTTQKITLQAAEEKLDYLHDRSSRLLRYAITDKLHESMEPIKL